MGKDGPDYSNVATGGEVNVTHPMHASQHQYGGSDEISVEGLSGELADEQPFAAHALGGAKHKAATLAQLNALISDATLDDEDDPRTPNAHKASHASSGADKLKYTRQIMWYLPSATLATGANQSASIVWRGPDLTLIRWDARVKTAPTDADLILDVLLGGTSLWASTPADRPTIADSATSGTDTDFDTGTIKDGDVLTFDIDQIGSTIAGGQVTLILEGECNLEAD